MSISSLLRPAVPAFVDGYQTTTRRPSASLVSVYPTAYGPGSL